MIFFKGTMKKCKKFWVRAKYINLSSLRFRKKHCTIQLWTKVRLECWQGMFSSRLWSKISYLSQVLLSDIKTLKKFYLFLLFTLILVNLTALHTIMIRLFLIICENFTWLFITYSRLFVSKWQIELFCWYYTIITSIPFATIIYVGTFWCMS